VRWHAARPGLEWAELPMAISVDGPRATLGTTLRVRVVLVRLDPARMTLALHAVSRPEGGAGAWDVSRAPAAAALALNAGQFTDDGPWGWVVHRGRELQPRGVGALAGALVIDTAGRARVVGAGTLDGLHAAARGGAVVEAVQSYPMLLDDDGALPRALRAHGQGVDLAHRDARLAVGELPDGRVLVALTRFDALGTTLGAVPIGLTVPETSALMGALGCRTAMMLDGGLSAQLLLRDAAGEARRWDGLRDVPLGLVATSGR
jgi:exopolysaccharide biosynthesis protein